MFILKAIAFASLVLVINSYVIDKSRSYEPRSKYLDYQRSRTGYNAEYNEHEYRPFFYDPEAIPEEAEEYSYEKKRDDYNGNEYKSYDRDVDRDDKQYKKPYEAGYEKHKDDYVVEKKERKDESYDRKYKKPYEAAYEKRNYDKDDYVKEQKEDSYGQDLDMDDLKYSQLYEEAWSEEEENDDDDVRKRHKPSPFEFISDSFLDNRLGSSIYDLDARIKDNFGYPEYAPFYVGSEWINEHLVPFYRSITKYSKDARKLNSDAEAY